MASRFDAFASMSYKDDLKKCNAWLRVRETSRVKARSSTHERREENEKKAAAVERVLRWQRRHRAVYRHRMKMYMRRRRVMRGGSLRAEDPAGK